MKKQIEYHSSSDQHGICTFTIRMSNGGYTPGHPEGEYKERMSAQVFRCDPRTHGFPRPEETNAIITGRKGAQFS